MTFYKTIQSNKYAKEVTLDDEEEIEIENLSKAFNVELLRECLDIANGIVKDENLREEDRAKIALALFEKQASHVVYWKEKMCKVKLEAKKRVEYYKKYN